MAILSHLQIDQHGADIDIRENAPLPVAAMGAEVVAFASISQRKALAA
jgi:hypothetical protein